MAAIAEPRRKTLSFPRCGARYFDEVGDAGGDVDAAHDLRKGLGRETGNVDDEGNVIGLVAAVKAQTVAEGGSWLVEIIAVIGVDDDDGVLVEPMFFERLENAFDAVVELARAAIVEGGDLLRISRAELVPFIFEIGAADEFIDVEVYGCFVFPLVVRIGKHAVVGLYGAIGEVIAGEENVAIKSLASGCHGADFFLDARGDNFWGDELRKGLDLGENTIADRVIEVEWDYKVGEDDGLAHVDLKAIER